MKLTHLASVLQDAGLKVEPQPGWRTRGGEMGDIKGIIAHHTAGPKSGIIPSLRTIIEGRPGLRGPLSQLALGRDGTWYVVAAGRSNHSGKGNWKGVTNGNSHFIGIEAENTGLNNDLPWPPEQVESYIKGVSALLKHFKLPAEAVIGHKEWAPHRKIDPTFDMKVFREKVGEIMARKKKLTQKEVIEDFYVPSTPSRRLESEEDEVKDIARYGTEESYPPEEFPLGEHKAEEEPKAWPWQDREEAKARDKKKKEQSTSPTDLLEQLGWTDYQAAALIAQAVVESKLDPKASVYTVNKVPTTKENPLAELSSFGIMKWPVSRLKNLDKFIEIWNRDNDDNKKKEDLDAQVRFVDWELRNSETPAARKLRESTEVTEAVRAATGYIRPSGWSEETPENSARWAERVSAAYGLLNK